MYRYFKRVEDMQQQYTNDTNSGDLNLVLMEMDKWASQTTLQLNWNDGVRLKAQYTREESIYKACVVEMVDTIATYGDIPHSILKHIWSDLVYILGNTEAINIYIPRAMTSQIFQGMMPGSVFVVKGSHLKLNDKPSWLLRGISGPGQVYDSLH